MASVSAEALTRHLLAAAASDHLAGDCVEILKLSEGEGKSSRKPVFIR